MKIRRNVLGAAVAVLVMAFFVGSWVLSAQAAEIATNASADLVIGQPDFTSDSDNQGNTDPEANTISLVPGIWSDGKKLIMCDLGNNRVTIFNDFPTTNNASADVVLGQSNMTSDEINIDATASNLFSPYGIFSDGQRLFIADTYHSRVLIYNSIPTTNGAAADVVVGQADMTSSDPNRDGAAGANTLAYPEGVYSDGTKLFIADTLNSRVLVYNSIPTANGVSADFVIGQVDFTSRDSNQGGSVGEKTLDMPTGVFAHSGKLFIADDDNNRVLIYNTIPTSSNPSADVVVGQADMTHNSDNQGGSPAANTISDPYSVMSDGTRLIISERSNHRVTIFNSIPTSNNASADIVVGQPDFTSNSINQGGTTAANTLYAQGSAYYAAGKLIVGDALNSRVLVFSMDAATTWRKNKTLRFYGGIKGKLKKKTLVFSGKNTNAKKGRAYAYQNGVLKRTEKIKNNGKWKLNVKEKQRSTNMLYQFRFYDRNNQLVSISDPFNTYLSSSSKVKSLTNLQPKTLEKNVSSQSSVGNSGKRAEWPKIKF